MTLSLSSRAFLAGSATVAAAASLPAVSRAQEAPGISFTVGSVVADGQALALAITVTLNLDTALPAGTTLALFVRALDVSGLVAGPSSIVPRLSTLSPTTENAGEYSFALPEDIPAHTPVSCESLWKTGLSNFRAVPRTQVLAAVVIPGESYCEVQSEEYIYEGTPVGPISSTGSSLLSS